VKSNAINIAEIITELEQTCEPERAGRSMDAEREESFEQLRARGYM